MAKEDQWCKLCEEKIKTDVVIVKGRKMEVCNECKSLLSEIDES